MYTTVGIYCTVNFIYIVEVCHMLLRSTSGTGASLAVGLHTVLLCAGDVTKVRQWLTLLSQKCLSHWHVIAEYLLLVALLSVGPLLCSWPIYWACCHSSGYCVWWIAIRVDMHSFLCTLLLCAQNVVWKSECWFCKVVYFIDSASQKLEYAMTSIVIFTIDVVSVHNNSW